MAGFPPEPPLPMQDAILEALRRGATAEALDTARTWVAEAPGLADAHRWLAVAQAQSGDTDAALEEAALAIDLAPDDAELHLLRGSLLLGSRQVEPARASLARATELDPNQLPAYFLQAQLALARGDLAEAGRLAKYAARIDPSHPQLTIIDAMTALRGGKPEVAISLLGDPNLAADEDPQRFFALGFAHMQLGHAAFAEHAFRRVLELRPDADGVRLMVSRLCQDQGRTDDALEVIEPLLERPDPGFALQRLAGLLESARGRPGRALRWLQPAFATHPLDPHVRDAAVEAWLQLDRANEAGTAIEKALAAHPADAGLYMALSRFTPRDRKRALVDRWLAAAPDDVDALEALATVQDLDPAADPADAIATTRRVVELDPSRVVSGLRLASLELQDDPGAAIARLRDLLSRHEDPRNRQLIGSRLALALDRAGELDDAVATWAAQRKASAGGAVPLPRPTGPRDEWPALAAVDDGTATIGWLWGAPGTWVELLAEQAARSGLPLQADRFGPRPPRDALQRPDAAAALVAGTLAPGTVVDGWRQALPARGVDDGAAMIDWLRWWDNGLLLSLRPHLQGALLLLAVRDPRDMLLDWLAFGTPGRLAFDSPQVAADWLAAMLDQVATLHEQNLYPHRLVRLDDAFSRPAAFIEALNDALDTQLPLDPQPRPALERLPPGRWRAYEGVLAGPFATLHAVADRLGYARN